MDKKNRLQRTGRAALPRRVLRGPLKYILAVIVLLLGAAAVLSLRNGFSEEGAREKAGSAPADTAEGTADTDPAEQEVSFEEKEIIIGCTGAMIMHSPILEAAEQPDGTYDFSDIFTYIAPYYSAPDFMTCELEAAVTMDPDSYSGHPMFHIPGSLVTAIAGSGVDLQLLATNHIYDAGSEGFHDTMDFFEQNDLAFTGVRKSEEEPRWYLADIGGVRVGFFDYTLETEGEGTWINALKVSETDVPLINSFYPEDRDPFYQEARLIIAQLRAAGAQFIIADMHWGMEYMLEPFEYQKEMAQTLCNMGVDALIGGHPHCEEPVSVVTSADGSRKMFCAYSVGNAMSNQMEEFMIMDMAGGYTEDGVIILLKIRRHADGTAELAGVDAIPTWMYRSHTEDGIWTYDFRILPLDDVARLEEMTGLAGIRRPAMASYERTMSVIGEGMTEAKKTFGTITDFRPAF